MEKKREKRLLESTLSSENDEEEVSWPSYRLSPTRSRKRQFVDTTNPTSNRQIRRKQSPSIASRLSSTWMQENVPVVANKPPISARIRFSFTSALSSNDAIHDQRKWHNKEIHYDIGCVLSVAHDKHAFRTSTRLQKDLYAQANSPEFLTRSLQNCLACGDVSNKPAFDSDELEGPVYEMLCTQSDTMDDIVDALQCVENGESRLVGEDDLEWWRSRQDDTRLRQLAFLSRLCRPMCLAIHNMSISKEDKDEEAVDVHSRPYFVGKLSFSFLDVLMRMPQLYQSVVDAVMIRVSSLETTKSNCSRQAQLQRSLLEAVLKSAENLPMRVLDSFRMSISTTPTVKETLVKMAPMAPSAITGGFGNNLTESAVAAFEHDTPRYQQFSKVWSQYLESGDGQEDKSKTTKMRSSNRLCDAVQAKRAELIAKRNQRQGNLLEVESFFGGLTDTGHPCGLEGKKLVHLGGPFVCSCHGSQPFLPPRLWKGAPLLTAEDISLEDFLEQTRFMATVNSTFPRPFYPDRSRPKLQGLQLSDQVLKQIKTIFFDRDGSLSDSIRKDIDSSAKHGYINFQNHMSLRERKDLRWQVPIKKHGCVDKIPTRMSIEKLLKGIINPDLETLSDLGILIGGTEDQSLHHDTARQVVTWAPEDPGTSTLTGAVSGWEIDRLEYNAAMSSPNAPSSMVVGMCDDNHCLLGVQKDQVVQCREGNKRMCRVIGGTGELFEVVRENDFLVVIRAESGVMFTGDFPHAGVRNISKGSEEDALMAKLNERIKAVLDGHPADDPLGQTRAVVDVLCGFPGLIRLCRLHCSTEMLTGHLRIPPNTIGFSDCLPNPPDSRCLECDESDEGRFRFGEHMGLDSDESDTEEEPKATSLTTPGKDGGCGPNAPKVQPKKVRLRIKISRKKIPPHALVQLANPSGEDEFPSPKGPSFSPFERNF
eukprot:CAMPEP_0116838908 /NCGR_PEP_ID=MMETSP0418-20121206/9475_1 /TAXON_ID=1158023 /ORGANISM="Astrosyne radiata, Strain 13vi08-1A" /LENGTH=932 /DNA_ID=CAMNT_0004468965 /DNA_START=205 /DNA_END=3004 /DNA_ORIENTATION=+